MLEQSIIISILFLIFLSLGLTNILTILAEKIIMLISLKLSSKQQIRKEEWLASLEYIPSQYHRFYYSISLIPLVFIKDPQILLTKTLHSCIDFGEILFSISFDLLGSIVKPMTVVLNIICSFAILFVIIPSLFLGIAHFESIFLPMLSYYTFTIFTIFFKGTPVVIQPHWNLLIFSSVLNHHYRISHSLNIFCNWTKKLMALDYQYQFFYLYILSIFISFILISIVVAEHI